MKSLADSCVDSYTDDSSVDLYVDLSVVELVVDSLAVDLGDVDDAAWFVGC